MQDFTEIMIFPSNMTRVQDSTGIWAFKVKLPDHNFKTVPLLDFGCSYVRQSLESGHVWWQNKNFHWILHRNISAGFENKTILEVFTVILVRWLHDDCLTRERIDLCLQKRTNVNVWSPPACLTYAVVDMLCHYGPANIGTAYRWYFWVLPDSTA